MFIYVLKLTQDKYYIGKTDNPKLRIESHVNELGSAWTKKYKLVNIIEIIPNCDNFDEDKLVKKYMNIYGIDNVRGGSYSQVQLSEKQKQGIRMELITSNDLCYLCGLNGHFSNKCLVSPQDKQNIIEYKEKINIKKNKLLEGGHSKDKQIKIKENIKIFEQQLLDLETKYKSMCCSRCGRTSHIKSSCYASKHINGNVI